MDSDIFWNTYWPRANLDWCTNGFIWHPFVFHYLDPQPCFKCNRDRFILYRNTRYCLRSLYTKKKLEIYYR